MLCVFKEVQQLCSWVFNDLNPSFQVPLLHSTGDRDKPPKATAVKHLHTRLAVGAKMQELYKLSRRMQAM